MANQKAFIPFIMAGHPTIQDFKNAIMTLIQVGADMIEVGVPFSDPVADGAINQEAADIALRQGMTLDATFQIISEIRNQGHFTPIILFTYLNPILAYGETAFIQAARSAGINGVLIVDLPPEEGLGLYRQIQEAGIEIVLLVSPTTNPARFPLYTQLNPYFLYYISRLGVTGIQNTLAENLESEIDKLRQYLPHQKIVVGFGISTIEQAAQVAKFADGVVIGSALVKSLLPGNTAIFSQLVLDFANTIHAVQSIECVEG